MKTHDRYTYEELGPVFEDTDVVVVPSAWYETFGYTVLEALCYGVPVILSGTVGAKDILAPGAGIVIEDINEDKLYETIRGLSVEQLQMMNRAIMNTQSLSTLKDMTGKIEKECYRQGNS